MEFKSINPYNGKELAVYKEQTEKEVNAVLEKSRTAFDSWRKVPIEERCRLLENTAGILRKNVDKYAMAMTLEMGKPLSEAREK